MDAPGDEAGAGLDAEGVWVTIGVDTVGVVTGPAVTDGTVTEGTLTVGTLTVGTEMVGTEMAGTETVGTEMVDTASGGELPSAAAVGGAAETASAAHPARTVRRERFIGLQAGPEPPHPTGKRRLRLHHLQRPITQRT